MRAILDITLLLTEPHHRTPLTRLQAHVQLHFTPPSGDHSRRAQQRARSPVRYKSAYGYVKRSDCGFLWCRRIGIASEEKILEYEAHFRANRKVEQASFRLAGKAPRAIVILTYFHIVSNTTGAGNIT